MDLRNNELKGLPAELGTMTTLSSLLVDGNPIKSIRRYAYVDDVSYVFVSWPRNMSTFAIFFDFFLGKEQALRFISLTILEKSLRRDAILKGKERRYFEGKISQNVF